MSPALATAYRTAHRRTAIPPVRAFFRSCRLLLICGVVAGLPGICQTPRQPGAGSPGGRRGGAKQAQTNPNTQAQEPMPNFSGTIHGIDSKLLTLEVPGPNLLEFRCSKKTKYFDGSKKIASSDLKPGDRVAVEARRALDGTLDAVNVRLDRQKPPQ
jgi:hypothetical protein